MAIRCTKCGTALTEGERFCPNCGENAPQPVPAAFQPAGYNASNPSSAVPVPPPSYNEAVYQKEDMPLSKWIITVFLTNFLGFVSLILLLIWGFGSGPKARQDYCKAMLIVKAVGIALIIVPAIMFLTSFVPAMIGYLEEFSEAYSREYAAFFSSFLR